MGNPFADFDLYGLMFGSGTALLYLEIALRCIVVYLYALFAVRYIAGRSGANLSILELLLVMALGSSVGGGLFTATVPLMNIITVITVIALIHRVLDALIIKSRKAKEAIDGQTVVAIRNGRVMSDAIENREIGPSEINALLRTKGVTNLGQVRIAYFEPHGELSVFLHDKPEPGLRIEPPGQIEAHVEEDRLEANFLLACITCGYTDKAPFSHDCPECGRDHWTKAV